ncbi:MAG TPA: DUF166 family protein [Phycisphaerae bacterium]|nr:DUF166 family protein [Phycisphaerae bacterium]
MRVLILRSRGAGRGKRTADAYTQEFKSAFAAKVIGNLRGRRDFCASCGPDCTRCRAGYRRRFGRSIVGVISLPSVMPYLLEAPGRHVPREVPPHDALLAINVHEQVLLEMLKRSADYGTRVVVVPLEAPDWMSGSARAEAEAICAERGVEVAFPKPFCAFDPPPGGLLDEFRRRFHIGKPRVELTVSDGKIEQAHVHVSAACGATYYVARWLTGRRIDEDLRIEVVAKRMHSYPCTASMKWDDELGETPMHVAGQAHYEILAPLTAPTPAEPELVRSPVGTMVARPVPVRDNIRNIERAKRAILEELSTDKQVSLDDLRARRKITPAALASAVLLLKQAGLIRTARGRIVKA